MPKETTKDHFLSRSALAEKLSMPLKQLTQLMIDSGWITQESDKQWRLTAKGEFEGGVYRQSKKYGEYIAWPARVIEHPIIRDSHDMLVSITVLSQPLEIPPRLFNRLLASLGWIEAFGKGWQLTKAGTDRGGVQRRNEDSAASYTIWPRKIIDQPDLKQSLQCMSVDNQQSLDGHHYISSAHCAIANWLYLQALHHSYQQQQFFSEDASLVPDFYLPSNRICIDYWPQSLSPTDLASQLQKRDLYKTLGLRHIETTAIEIASIDNQLSKAFLQEGISLY